MPGFLQKLLSFGADKELKEFEKIVSGINALEPRFEKMGEDELRGMTTLFRERNANGESLDSLLPEAFAVVREAAKRTLGMRHFDVQLEGGIALHRGMIAEMKTGEGKTLVSTLPGYLNALEGKGVHLVTVNDYLAQRDSEWMGRVYRYLGLNVGLILNGMGIADKHPAYAADITYGTNSEFGFDYLRDNMVMRARDRVQRGHHYAIVDEVDSILIDEARTPLIISGAGTQSASTYREFASAVRGLVPGVHFEMDEAKHTIAATEEGLARVERILGKDIYGDLSGALVNHLQQALRAEYMYHRDQQYVVVHGEVKIVDEFTGRIMEGRRYSEGLHQAIEAKEGVLVREENQTLATITLQNYFRLYDKLAGMTGTAMTEDAEFREIYHIGVQAIPPNRPNARVDHDDKVYRNIDIKFNAVANDVAERHRKGQPCLVGTISIESSERLSRILEKRGIPHEVLNAKHHAREAAIVAQAGREGAVTIATNMAGRGTDILLGGNPEALAEDILVQQGYYANRAPEEIDPEEHAAAYAEALKQAKEICKAERAHVIRAGGLCVIGTERHESRRIDNQLRGRSGRQGDVGETQFYLSLEDDLMRLFGGDRMDSIAALMERYEMPDDLPIQAKLVTRAVEGAQRKVEEINFSMRKNVLEYDDVMNMQRQAIYEERNKILDGKSMIERFSEVIEDVVDARIQDFLHGVDEEGNPVHDEARLHKWVIGLTGKPEFPPFPEGATDEQIAQQIIGFVSDCYSKKIEEFSEPLMQGVATRSMLRVIDVRWMTYLQEMDYLKAGIGLRGFGQRDPLVEYRAEAYAAFGKLRTSMYEDFIRAVLYYRGNAAPDTEEGSVLRGAKYSGPTEIDGDQSAPDTVSGRGRSAGKSKASKKERKKERAAQRAARAAQTQQDGQNAQGGKGGQAPAKPITYVKSESGDPFVGVGRNDECPCGSGLKFKNCHGKRRR